MSSTTASHTSAKVISIILMVAGAIMIVVGVSTYATVSATLGQEQVVVSEDACLGGQSVAGPLTAYCEAQIIADHALDITGGLTYAQLDREDPLRAVAMNGSFLRASLFTSVVAFGVSILIVGLGILFILVGAALMNLAGHRPRVTTVTT
jgi:hypothetical protein